MIYKKFQSKKIDVTIIKNLTGKLLSLINNPLTTTHFHCQNELFFNPYWCLPAHYWRERIKKTIPLPPNPEVIKISNNISCPCQIPIYVNQTQLGKTWWFDHTRKFHDWQNNINIDIWSNQTEYEITSNKDISIYAFESSTLQETVYSRIKQHPIV